MKTTFDPDITRRDDAPYWAAALLLAIRTGDRDREATARTRLRSLGYELRPARQQREVAK